MKTQKPLTSREQFIRFFSRIPRNKWTTSGVYDDGHGKRCAFGHVGARTYSSDTTNGRNLASLYNQHPKATSLPGLTLINDQRSEDFPQRSAKARVLAFLKGLPRRASVA